MTPRALIFDFDGLLVDTEVTAFRAWQAVLAEHGAELPLTRWQASIGRQSSVAAMLSWLERTTGPCDREDVVGRWTEINLARSARQPLRPGAGEFLTAAAQSGIPLAVASGATRDWVEGHLTRLGVQDLFTAVSTVDGRRPKPAPDVYLGALEGLGVPAADAVAFEDSPVGVAAAVSAGVRCFAVPSAVTAGLDFPGVTEVLPSFDAMTPDALIVHLSRTITQNTTDIDRQPGVM